MVSSRFIAPLVLLSISTSRPLLARLTFLAFLGVRAYLALGGLFAGLISRLAIVVALPISLHWTLMTPLTLGAGPLSIFSELCIRPSCVTGPLTGSTLSRWNSLRKLFTKNFHGVGTILTAFVDISVLTKLQWTIPTHLLLSLDCHAHLRPRCLSSSPRSQSFRFQQGRGSTTASTTFMQGLSSTTTSSLVAACPHPCSPLDTGDVCFHMAVPSGEFASTSVASSGSVCDVLFALCRALRGHGRLPPDTPYRSTDNVVVGRRTVQVFIHPDRGSSPPCCWVWYPEWRSEPAFLSCSTGLSRSALLRKLGITDRSDVRIALQGAVDPSFFEPSHGDIIVIHRGCTAFIQVPLVNLWPRFQDVLALLLPVHAPSAAVLADDHRLQHYWRSCIGRFQALLGLNRPGARVVIAGITQPSLVLCTGSALPPLQADVQRYYNDFLASHFGWIRIVDTGQLCGDACLMAERWLHPFDRHWVIQTPHGIIPVAGDAVGLAEAPFSSG